LRVFLVDTDATLKHSVEVFPPKRMYR